MVRGYAKLPSIAPMVSASQSKIEQLRPGVKLWCISSHAPYSEVIMTGASHRYKLLRFALSVANATQKASPPKHMRCTSLSAFQNVGICCMVGIDDSMILVRVMAIAGNHRAKVLSVGMASLLSCPRSRRREMMA